MKKFTELGLSESSLQAIQKKGFEEPTEIQEKTIPLLLSSTKDVVAQAQTGTGKTAAFGLVFIEKLAEKGSHPQALVLAPTRELAIQVAEEINSLKGTKKLNVVPIYGGQSMSMQLKQLKGKCDVIVGTPGRVLDHIKRKSINLKHLKYVVLDEADEMLNMGFIDDIETILASANDDRQLLLFSATMPSRILKLAKKYMKEFELVETKRKSISDNLVDQIYFEVQQRDKFEALCRIVDVEDDFYAIVFCRTKVDVDSIARKLADRGYAADAIHGDIVQAKREQILNKFKAKKLRILVATDVAARGIDVNNLTHVINYALPQDPEAYVHRIGRTGRAGNKGTAITFITPSEYKGLAFIKRVAKTEIRKEKIPDVNDVIKLKKEKIVTKLHAIAEKSDLKEYNEFSEKFLSDIDKDVLISALLKYSFATELDASSYSNIKEFSNNRNERGSVDNTGKTRLFMTIGKIDGINPSSLLDFIEEEFGIKKSHIGAVDIFDTFSFVSAPFKEAEIILAEFENKKGSMKVKIEKAADKKGGGGGGGRRKPSGGGRSGGGKGGYGGKSSGGKSYGGGKKKPYSGGGKKR